MRVALHHKITCMSYMRKCNAKYYQDQVSEVMTMTLLVNANRC